MVNDCTMKRMRIIWLAAIALQISASLSGQTPRPSWQQDPPATPTGSQNAYMPPPDPGSQIPLTGFDWMLLASFAAGAWWLVRHREALAERK